MIRSIAYFAYPVRNARQARNFYEGVLGLKPTSVYGDAWIEYEVGGTAFAIATVLEGESAGARGGLIAFEVDNLDDSIAALKAKGVRILKEVFETPVCRMACIADPDGNNVTLHACKHRPG